MMPPQYGSGAKELKDSICLPVAVAHWISKLTVNNVQKEASLKTAKPTSHPIHPPSITIMIFHTSKRKENENYRPMALRALVAV